MSRGFSTKVTRPHSILSAFCRRAADELFLSIILGHAWWIAGETMFLSGASLKMSQFDFSFLSDPMRYWTGVCSEIDIDWTGVDATVENRG